MLKNTLHSLKIMSFKTRHIKRCLHAEHYSHLKRSLSGLAMAFDATTLRISESKSNYNLYNCLLSLFDRHRSHLYFPWKTRIFGVDLVISGVQTVPFFRWFWNLGSKKKKKKKGLHNFWFRKLFFFFNLKVIVWGGNIFILLFTLYGRATCTFNVCFSLCIYYPV